jgi:hypothetical protein
LQDKIMVTRFRSGDAARAAAKKLSQLVSGHDYEAWPDRGHWVLVTRYHDDDGHLRFKFVGPEDRLRKEHHMQETVSRKPEPPRRNRQVRPVANNIGERGDESARRHRRVYVEAMQQ